jgi:hypothetical protein
MASIQDCSVDNPLDSACITIAIPSEQGDVGSTDPVFWLIFCTVFTVIAVVCLVLYRRAIARRRKIVRPLPASDEHPDGSPGPAAFVTMDASRVSGRAAAAVVLDLARRGALAFRLAPDGRSRVRRTGSDVAVSSLERGVLQAVAEPGGGWCLPWAAASRADLVQVRRAIVRESVGHDLVTNLCTDPPLPVLFGTPPWRIGRVAGVLAFATALTVLVFRPSADVVVSGLYTVVLLLGMCALLPWTLTEEGASLRDRWHAHARWLEEKGHFSDVPAAGIVVWEEHLVAAAITGLADRAIGELTPPSWRPRT